MDELEKLTGASSELRVTYKDEKSDLVIKYAVPKPLNEEPEPSLPSTSKGHVGIVCDSENENSNMSEDSQFSKAETTGIGSTEDIRRAVSDGVLDAYKTIQPTLRKHAESADDDTDTVC